MIVRNRLIKRYVTACKARILAGEEPRPIRWKDFLSQQSADTALILKSNLEAYARREPYVSSRRTFGTIDSIQSIRRDDDSRELVLRGWLFDLLGPVRDLKLSVDGSPCRTVVYPISRPDVQAAFPFESSTECGFIAVGAQGAVGASISVEAAYSSGNASSVTATLEFEPNAPHHDRSSDALIPESTVLLLASREPNALNCAKQITYMLERVGQRWHTLRLYEDGEESRSDDDIPCGDAPSLRGGVDLASSLLGWCGPGRLLIVCGGGFEFLRDTILPVLVSSPTSTSAVWLTEESRPDTPISSELLQIFRWSCPQSFATVCAMALERSR